MQLTNSEIIVGLASKNSKVIKQIYEDNFHSAVCFVVKNKGNIQDAEDIFQESLIAVYKLVQKENFTLTCSFSTFLNAVYRKLWYKELDKRNRELNKNVSHNVVGVSMDGFQDLCFEKDDLNLLDTAILEYEKNRIFNVHFNNLKEICKKVLSLFFGNKSMKEIAEASGYNSDKTAKSKKLKCQKILIENIRRDPEYNRIMSRIEEYVLV